MIAVNDTGVPDAAVLADTERSPVVVKSRDTKVTLSAINVSVSVAQSFAVAGLKAPNANVRV